METKRKIEEVKSEQNRYNEFLKYLQKRMKELERDERRFREAVTKERKLS